MEEINQKLTVIIDDTILKPWCQHGPTLLFKRIQNEKEINFFACSACRNRKECPFYEEYDESQVRSSKDIHQKWNDKYRNNLTYKEIQEINPKERWYCKRCQCPFLNNNKSSKHSSHEIISFENLSGNISDILAPKSNDKKEAQYFFASETLQFYKSLFNKLALNKILCIGAPALHDYLRKNDINSFLLDIDDRLLSFYTSEQFALYNMFNHHFFMGDSAKQSFTNFLKCKENEKLCIFTDPPFGCRTEPLADTLRKIICEFKTVNSKITVIVPVIWVFPYFMENYIQKVMPELSMCDYKINYTNHKTYNKTSKARKDLGSPIRFFTNIFPSYIDLPRDEYSFCKICDRFVDKQNQHCKLCGICPSKNGSTYRHCKECHLCVKPTYKHCQNCKKCTQIDGHNCSVYKKQITCYVCRAKGHAENECNELKRIHKLKSLKNKTGNCLICFTNGHTHVTCPNYEAFRS